MHLSMCTLRTAVLALSLSACSPLRWTKGPLVAAVPARYAAENMIRLDATLRSGCESVRNIEKLTEPENARTQRWIAHTCTGDLSYDIVTQYTNQGPVVKLLFVADPLRACLKSALEPSSCVKNAHLLE